MKNKYILLSHLLVALNLNSCMLTALTGRDESTLLVTRSRQECDNVSQVSLKEFAVCKQDRNAKCASLQILQDMKHRIKEYELLYVRIAKENCLQAFFEYLYDSCTLLESALVLNE